MTCSCKVSCPVSGSANFVVSITLIILIKAIVTGFFISKGDFFGLLLLFLVAWEHRTLSEVMIHIRDQHPIVERSAAWQLRTWTFKVLRDDHNEENDRPYDQ